MGKDAEAGENRGFIDRRFTLGAGTSSKSFELESWSYVQHQDYQLQILQKKEYVSSRPQLLATPVDRLAFMSTYVTLTSKREIATTSQIVFADYILSVSMTMFVKVLPQYFSIMFLSLYSPEEHIYVSKMVPLFWGACLQVISGSLFMILCSVDALEDMARFIFDGYYRQFPWTKCPPPSEMPSHLICYPYEIFRDKLRDPHTTAMFSQFKTYTVDANNKTVSEIICNSYMNYFSNSRWFMFATPMPVLGVFLKMFMLISIAATGMLIYRKKFWQVLKTVYIIMIAFYLGCLLYVILKYIDREVPHRKRPIKYVPDELLEVDFPAIGIAMTCPPILHILYARSVEPFDVNWDSGISVVYCYVFIIFRQIVDYYVKMDVEADIGWAYNLKNYNVYSSIFFYPLFFSFLPLGDVFTMMFFIFKFLNEFLTVACAFQCFIETVFYEWPWRKLRKWMISLIAVPILSILTVITQFYTRVYLYACSQIISNATEVIAITAFYPIGRMMDDITFHQGSPPAKIRFYSQLLLPFYYVYKVYITINALMKVADMRESYGEYDAYRTLLSHIEPFVHKFWIIPVLFVLIGIIYAFIMHIFVRKQKCASLMRPKPTWGPRDHVTRQLRKQYDSRDYIPSQSSRYLARHMLVKAETACYRIETKYADPKQEKLDRRQTMITTIPVLKDEETSGGGGGGVGFNFKLNFRLD